MISFRSLLLGTCVLALGLAGCDANDPELGPDRPALISPDAFDLSEANFPEAQNRGSQAGANFTNAALRVGVVNIAVGLHLIVPSLATHAALDADPVIESGTWIWANTVRINEQDVTFSLAGTPDGSAVDWSMQISTTDPQTGEVYDDFVLYTAETAFDGRSGSWQLYYRVEGVRTRVLEASFDVDSETDKTLRFRVPEGIAERGGDSVEYGRDGTARSFDWTQVAEGFDHLIEWDATTKAGSITATNYNGGVRACWDAALEDVACN